MTSNRLPRSVLVPVLDGDITEGALAYARSALVDPDARLALVHVVSPRDGTRCPSGRHEGPDDGSAPRWRQIAATVQPDHVFVDAVSGDPVDVVLSQIDRFRSDLVVMGRPHRAGARGAWVDRVLARLRYAEPGRAVVVGDRTDEETPIRVEREPETARSRQARPHGTRRNDGQRFPTARRAAARRHARPEAG
jgi:nucleotide-binding universal stress UspA family protein